MKPQLYRWRCKCGNSSRRFGSHVQVENNARAHARRCGLPVTISEVYRKPVPPADPPRAVRPVLPETPNPEAWIYG